MPLLGVQRIFFYVSNIVYIINTILQVRWYVTLLACELFSRNEIIPFDRH